MDFELKTLSRPRTASEKCDALIVLVPTDVQAQPDALSTLITSAIKARHFQGEPGKLLQSYRSAGLGATRLILAGVGSGSPRDIKRALGAAMAALKASPAQKVIVSLSWLAPDAPDLAMQVQTLVTSCAEAGYSYRLTRSKPAPVAAQTVIVGVPAIAAARTGFATGQALAQGIELAREWGNRPANHATPTLLAGAARALAKLRRIQVDVLGPREVARLGMGSFMAVARGSSEPLRFIVLRYSGAGRSQAPVVLVGKGITFDTGGISIKPAPEMDEMKFDMCGAASVLGTFRALADLQPRLNVIGLIPACENMPDGQALKPGDVVRSMSGQTIEVLNTDAEGRLVLCDALTYAERFKPRSVIDIATLTGACMVALGGVRAGLFSSNDALGQALFEAGERSLDLCWRMPLDEEYAEGLKSNFADVANVGGRAGGAVTAAKFLQRFAGKFAWAHLDIAGSAWNGGGAKGSTGRPVALLVDFLLDQAAQGPAALESRSGGAAGKAAAKNTPLKAPAKAAAKTPVAKGAKGAIKAPAKTSAKT
jgi:leucyl aminopeptidase